MPNADSQLLLRQLAGEDATAEQELFTRYAERIRALAATKLSRHAAADTDAEDITQSALQCFFAGARDGRWTYTNPGDLWRLLAGIVINKCKAFHRRQMTLRRDIRRERPLNVRQGLSNVELSPPASHPSDRVLLWEAASVIFRALSSEEHELVKLKLGSASTEEISQALNVSVRSARRKLAALEQKLREVLSSSYVVTQPAISPSEGEADQSDFADALDQLFQQVGKLRYQDLLLEQLVGSGGMGKVFRAVLTTSGETVAVKALARRHHSNPAAVTAFLNEVSLMAQINHPGIVALRGLGQFPAGGLFLVMDFVRGENLGQRIERAPLPPPKALQIALDVARSLHAAHTSGVVHCDLKPANILLSKGGRTLVTDFGFARLIAPHRLGMPDLPLRFAPLGGTPEFAAPEQLDGLPDSLAPTVDIYALGKVLMAMLLRRVPATHQETRAALAELQGAPRAICGRCTKANPAARYSSVKECADQLHSALQRIDASP
ncbi:MAG: protein kinase [Pirellulales bacterium]|nr:protein kinase [Pirellulales bacterium]